MSVAVYAWVSVCVCVCLYVCWCHLHCKLMSDFLFRLCCAQGANSHGQLGLGYESELCMTPQRLSKCSFVPQLVRCIRGGGGHVLILDSNGRLHACGWNNRGQLGLNSDDECHSEFSMVPTEYFEVYFTIYCTLSLLYYINSFIFPAGSTCGVHQLRLGYFGRYYLD